MGKSKIKMESGILYYLSYKWGNNTVFGYGITYNDDDFCYIIAEGGGTTTRRIEQVEPICKMKKS